MRRLVAIAAAAVSVVSLGAGPAHAAAAPAGVSVQPAATALVAATRAPALGKAAPTKVAPRKAAPRMVVRPVARPTALVGRAVTAAAFGMHDSRQAATNAYGALRLWDTGTTRADIEPAKGAYSWARLDAYVAYARARKMKVTLVLGSTPAWAAATTKAPGTGGYLGPAASSPPRDRADWVRYVGAVATRYRGRIDSYQIWNEAALPGFWSGTPAQLADLTQLANAKIKSVDRRALVVATAVLPRQTAWSTWASAYLRALAVRKWPVDVFAVHSYQPDAVAHPDGRALTLRRAQDLLTSLKAPAKPLWDTEANYTSKAFTKTKVTGQRAADYTARAYLDSLRSGVDRTFWYAWDNPVPNLGITMTSGSTSQRGLVSVQKWVVGSTFRGCAAVKAKTKVVVTTCTFQRGKVVSRVVWASANARTALPAVTAKRVCQLLTGCRPVTKATYVTTSPQLLG